jgi:hypothetical protein
MMEQITEIYENIKGIVLPLIGSGIIACEITPIIKIKPVSMFLGWVGRKMNKDVKEKLNSVEVKVDAVQVDLQNHKVESWRRDILNFADSLSLGRDKSKEQFLYIISLHDVYLKYIQEKGIINGQINVAYDYIEKQYNEHLENNSFYKGK